ncbi:uncharacterized protein LOC124265767 [Haliotis rubra]|nr:uncharacterized protein LOC124265767 [Haliotis rubra]
MYDLSSRMEVNCDTSQHSVNLRINASVDRNLESICSNMDANDISNSITIELHGGFGTVATTSAAVPSYSSESNRIGTADTTSINTSDRASGQFLNTCLAVMLYLVLSGGMI